MCMGVFGAFLETAPSVKIFGGTVDELAFSRGRAEAVFSLWADFGDNSFERRELDEKRYLRSGGAWAGAQDHVGAQHRKFRALFWSVVGNDCLSHHRCKQAENPCRGAD